MEPRRDRFRLRVLTVLARVLTILLVQATSYLPKFDSSASVLLPAETDRLTSSLLRWDAFHFSHIAQHGYVYEHEWAFFPGVPMIQWLGLKLLSMFVNDPGAHEASLLSLALQGGALFALACDTTVTLYDLTLEHFGPTPIAMLASALSLLPSSPATLRFAAYSEPFFTYLSYKGMLYCARKQWFLASCTFALAGLFRSNGIFLAGFILWGLLVEPFVQSKFQLDKFPLRNIVSALSLTSLVLTPFVWHQYRAYTFFCRSHPDSSLSALKTPWCDNFPPSIYTHVQSTYWNVGLFRYWTLSQLPNFIISAPPLALILVFSTYHLRHAIPQLVSPPRVAAKRQPVSPFLNPSVTPHVIHALITAFLLLFASHTQIILRVAASMPVLYWAAAWLYTEVSFQEGRRDWGKWWVRWSAVWGAISILLWVTFLPPA